MITNAATGAESVKALVFVDALIPDEGENVFQILGGSGSAVDIPDPTVVSTWPVTRALAGSAIWARR